MWVSGHDPKLVVLGLRSKVNDLNHSGIHSLISFQGIGLGLWCLMPLSTIFQLYLGSYESQTSKIKDDEHKIMKCDEKIKQKGLTCG